MKLLTTCQLGRSIKRYFLPTYLPTYLPDSFIYKNNFKNGPKQTSFYFRYFHMTSTSTRTTILTINYKSIDGELRTRTWGCRMVGADESTELWAIYCISRVQTSIILSVKRCKIRLLCFRVCKTRRVGKFSIPLCFTQPILTGPWEEVLVVGTK